MSLMLKLADLLLDTKDGEWGLSESAEGLVAMLVIRGTDFEAVRRGEIAECPIRYIPKHLAERKALRVNDIILETAGGSRDRPTGRSLLVTEQLLEQSSYPITCASFCRYLRVNDSMVDPNYVYWFLQKMYANGEMANHQVQHTGVGSLPVHALCELCYDYATHESRTG